MFDFIFYSYFSYIFFLICICWFNYSKKYLNLTYFDLAEQYNKPAFFIMGSGVIFLPINFLFTIFKSRVYFFLVFWCACGLLAFFKPFFFFTFFNFDLNFSFFMVLLPLLLLFDIALTPAQNIYALTSRSLFGFFFIFFVFFFYILINTKILVHNLLEARLFMEISFYLFLDPISVFLVFLSLFLMPICVLVGWQNVRYRVKEYLMCLCLIESMLVIFFTTNNLFFFFILFESILIPMYFLITIWGSRIRKIHASFQFFFFTVGGSLFLFIVLGFLFLNFGFSDWSLWKLFFNNLENVLYLGKNDNLCFQLICSEIDSKNQFFSFIGLDFLDENNILFLKKIIRLVWFSFFIGFAIKIPLYPLHIWLPEAHVEAPTAGSVILAGILLKMGIYGFIRILLAWFPQTTLYFQPLVILVSLLGIIITPFITLRQNDFKKIIAYSSVGHMGFCSLGLMVYDTLSMGGSFFITISHGFVSSLLFICVGFLYDRYKTRLIGYYGGLVQYMPNFTLFFFLVTLANMSLPLTSSFIGELAVILGIFTKTYSIGLMLCFGVIVGGIYAIWLFNRICFGRLNILLLLDRRFCDLSSREFAICLSFLFLIFWMGIFPAYLLNAFEWIFIGYFF